MAQSCVLGQVPVILLATLSLEEVMAIFEEDDRPTPFVHSVGEQLATLSEVELADRIVLLWAEIERIEATLAAKKASREAAAAHFKIDK